MKTTGRLTAGLFLLALLAGCTTARESGTYQAPAQAGPVPTRAVVAGDWRAVSLRLQENLAREPFVMQPAGTLTPARRVVFSFETDKPELWVDCGSRAGRFEDSHGKVSEGRFDLAADADYLSADAQGRPVSVRHATHLTADAAIELFPRPGDLSGGAQGTEVVLDVAYHLAMADKARRLDSEGRGTGGLDEKTVDLRFGSTTGAAGAGTLETPACRSTGALERRLLEAAGAP